MTAAATADVSLPRRLALRDTLEINLVGLATIPMLAFIAPRVEVNDDTTCRVRIPLNYRTKNHMGSMYFGVLAAGADVASGIPVVRAMRAQERLLVPSFKDFHADFLRRAVGDVVFENTDVAAVRGACDEAIRTGERVNLLVHIVATVPAESPTEAVARFTTTLSLKYKADAKQPWMQRMLAKL